MFNDRQEELERLRNELLDEEVEEQPAQEDDDLLSDEMLNELLGMNVQAYNTDKVDTKPEEISQQLQQPEEPKLTGLLVTAGLLTAGIFLVICWWVFRYLGII